jgi:hypothetical protein
MESQPQITRTWFIGNIQYFVYYDKLDDFKKYHNIYSNVFENGDIILKLIKAICEKDNIKFLDYGYESKIFTDFGDHIYQTAIIYCATDIINYLFKNNIPIDKYSKELLKKYTSIHNKINDEYKKYFE